MFTSRYFATRNRIPHAGKDSHYPFLVLSTQYSFSFTSTPPRLWTQPSGSDHLSFSGIVTTPLASHASGQLGPVNRPCVRTLSLGGSIGRITTLESPMFWVDLSISILLFHICARIERVDLPFHPLFPTALFAALLPLL